MGRRVEFRWFLEDYLFAGGVDGCGGEVAERGDGWENEACGESFYGRHLWFGGGVMGTE